MNEDMGKSLQMKGQDELIGKDGVYKKRTGINKFKVPAQTTSKSEKFVNAQTCPLSTIPRSKEEHEELDDLNNKFSERLDKMEKVDLQEERKNKEKEDGVNENKKRIVTTQDEEKIPIANKQICPFLIKQI
ncbi:hypothetical protein RhiirA4_464608 [Rhizophagus irregularis]|uniref:Uncharacterized protein n=1 Tax=Rhizophagus irregularis TaxID=588596 RepID=A0A2I1GQG0_9GLOM|nr:hypothetical protein RhiirA4_464608 [Rhizophagus irregularis]